MASNPAMAEPSVADHNTTSASTLPDANKQPVVCVFCGACPGTSPMHVAAARALAHVFAQRNIKLVYGGGTTGVMGELARTLVSLRGPEAVRGVIPRALLEKERNYGPGGEENAAAVDEATFGETVVVPDMHTRKQTMARAVIESGPGGGFVALSGGYGTLEELMEVVTWNQLGIHARPVVVYNVDGYWDGLLAWVKRAVAEGFIADNNAGIMAEATTAELVWDQLRDYKNAEGRFKLHWEQR